MNSGATWAVPWSPVVATVLQSQVVEQRQPVFEERVGGIGGPVVGPRTGAVGAQVRHDRPPPALREPRGDPRPDPVVLADQHVAVEEDDRPALTEFSVKEIRAVAADVVIEMVRDLRW